MHHQLLKEASSMFLLPCCGWWVGLFHRGWGTQRLTPSPRCWGLFQGAVQNLSLRLASGCWGMCWLCGSSGWCLVLHGVGACAGCAAAVGVWSCTTATAGWQFATSHQGAQQGSRDACSKQCAQSLMVPRVAADKIWRFQRLPCHWEGVRNAAANCCMQQ